MAHTKTEIYKLCLEKRVPFAPVRNMAEVVNDAHLKAREYFIEVNHPVAGTFRYPGAPGRLSETPWVTRKEKLETLRGGVIWGTDKVPASGSTSSTSAGSSQFRTWPPCSATWEPRS